MGGGRTHALQAVVVRPLTTRLRKDGASFLSFQSDSRWHMTLVYVAKHDSTTFVPTVSTSTFACSDHFVSPSTPKTFNLYLLTQKKTNHLIFFAQSGHFRLCFLASRSGIVQRGAQALRFQSPAGSSLYLAKTFLRGILLDLSPRPLWCKQKKRFTGRHNITRTALGILGLG